MRAALVSYLVLWIVSAALAAKLNCPEAHFWNGTSCKRCSGCPVGQGVKTNCSKSSDTICQDCWPGFDYSNSTGMEACKGCDEDSNCLPGKPKEIQKCNVTSPKVCDGCEEGFYFDRFDGQGGICVKCSRPCRENKVETQSCKTEHDRVCSEVPSTTEKTSTERPTTFSKDTNVSRKVSASLFPTRDTGKEDDKGSETEKTDQPLSKKLWLWAIVACLVVTIITMVIVTAVRRRQGNNERSHDSVEEDIQLIQRGQPPPRGLGQPIKSIKMEERRFIANFLNGVDSYGHLYFLRVAEEVGLVDECGGFVGSQNPTDAFLTLYSEKEGSTVRALVDALRKCELTHFACEIEKKFASVKAANTDESTV